MEYKLGLLVARTSIIRGCKLTETIASKDCSRFVDYGGSILAQFWTNLKNHIRLNICAGTTVF